MQRNEFLGGIDDAIWQVLFDLIYLAGTNPLLTTWLGGTFIFVTLGFITQNKRESGRIRVKSKRPKKRSRNPARPSIRRKSDAALPKPIRPEEGVRIRLRM